MDFYSAVFGGADDGGGGIDVHGDHIRALVDEGVGGIGFLGAIAPTEGVSNRSVVTSGSTDWAPKLEGIGEGQRPTQAGRLRRTRVSSIRSSLPQRYPSRTRHSRDRRRSCKILAHFPTTGMLEDHVRYFLESSRAGYWWLKAVAMIICAPCEIMFSMVVVAPASSGHSPRSMISTQGMFSWMA